jgi:hypothetical protein
MLKEIKLQEEEEVEIEVEELQDHIPLEKVEIDKN